jgi:hypothetical protein
LAGVVRACACVCVCMEVSAGAHVMRERCVGCVSSVLRLRLVLLDILFLPTPLPPPPPPSLLPSNSLPTHPHRRCCRVRVAVVVQYVCRRAAEDLQALHHRVVVGSQQKAREEVAGRGLVAQQGHDLYRRSRRAYINKETGGGWVGERETGIGRHTGIEGDGSKATDVGEGVCARVSVRVNEWVRN